MQNQEIVKIIENLKGRRNYEEKKASKLGFASLYDYFEDKISKKQKALEEEGVKVFRPSVFDINKFYSSPFWSSNSNNIYNVRD